MASYRIRHRVKGQTFGGCRIVHETRVQEAADFREAFYASLPHPPNTTWYDITNEDTGEKITLAQIRARERSF